MTQVSIQDLRRIAESLAALRWLQVAGCLQYYCKYCSTFDSTPRGNIGPVLEALMDALDCRFTIATPAFPDSTYNNENYWVDVVFTP